MDTQTFASTRKSQLESADDELRPFVESALHSLLAGDPDWEQDLVTAASQLWLDVFIDESDDGKRGLALARFRRDLKASLEKTAQPEMDVEQAQIDRITYWLSGYVVNSATVAGAFSRGVRFKRWTTMHDDAVRHLHVEADGQIVSIGGTFDIGGHRLHYPGEPVGPPEGWIQCRCLAQPASREGEIMSGTTYTIGPEDSVDDNPDVEPGYDVFDMAEVIADAPVQQPDPDVASGAVVEWTDESGTRYYGPFDTAENAQAWIESDNAPFDGESRVIGLVDVPKAEAVIAAAVDPTDIAVEPPDEEDLVEDVPEDGEELITEIPVHGVLAPEGVSTGDGRKFAIGALSTRTLPIPLRYETVSTHGGQTSDVVTIGRVDEAWRNDETDEWEFRGAIVLTRPFAQEAIDGMIDGTVRGVSIDGDDAEVQIEEPSGEGDDIMEALADMMNPSETVFSKMRVAGLTIVPIPAFETAYIALGHEFSERLGVDSGDDGSDSGDADATLVAAGGSRTFGRLLALARASGSRQSTWLAVRADVLAHDADRSEEAYEAASGGVGEFAGSDPAGPDRGSSLSERDLLQPVAHGARAGSGEHRTRELGEAFVAAGDLWVWAPIHAGEHADVDAPDAGWFRVHGADLSGLRASGEPGFVPPTFSRCSICEAGLDLDAVEPEGVQTFAPGTHDGPGWVTHPVPTERIRRYWARGQGAAKIRWNTPGAFNRCRQQLAKYIANPEWLAGTCANLYYEATGRWPGRQRGDKGLALLASAGIQASAIARLVEQTHPVYPAEYFSEPTLDRAFPMKIDRETRRIQGYVSEWGVCHVGITGFCQEVPRSSTDYAYFKKGVVDTTEGEQFVGCLTFGGHAKRSMSMSRASEFYDKPEAVRAFVNVGENAYGVWYSGIIPPDVTDDDITKMRGIGAVSGDWREVRGALELIGVPVVNTPGLPVRQLAASAGRQTVMIGAGALKPDPVEQLVAAASVPLDATAVAGIARTAVAEYRHQEKLAARAEPARAKVRERRLAAARARVERG